MGIGTYASMDEEWAEVAFVVRDDFQHAGIAACLFQELQRVAMQNGLKGFMAAILPSNKAMISLCRKFFANPEIDNTGDELEIWMRFPDTALS